MEGRISGYILARSALLPRQEGLLALLLGLSRLWIGLGGLYQMVVREGEVEEAKQMLSGGIFRE